MLVDSERHKLFSRRAALIVGGKVALLSALSARMYYLQVIEADRYRTLAEEMNGQIHALAMQTLTPAEWNESEQQRATSPECLGGSKD